MVRLMTRCCESEDPYSVRGELKLAIEKLVTLNSYPAGLETSNHV